MDAYVELTTVILESSVEHPVVDFTRVLTYTTSLDDPRASTGDRTGAEFVVRNIDVRRYTPGAKPLLTSMDISVPSKLVNGDPVFRKKANALGSDGSTESSAPTSSTASAMCPMIAPVEFKVCGADKYFSLAFAVEPTLRFRTDI
jgi:hypothetical protein